MRNRVFRIIEVGLQGRSFLTQPGNWHIVSFFEDEEPKEGLGEPDEVPSGQGHGGGLSYLAANHWAAELSDAVERFVRENKNSCQNCGCSWIELSGELVECPYCGGV